MSSIILCLFNHNDEMKIIVPFASLAASYVSLDAAINRSLILSGRYCYLQSITRGHAFSLYTLLSRQSVISLD